MSAAQPTQLTLGIRLSDESRFDNYLVSAANKALVEMLVRPDPGQKFLFIRAEKGAGLSHLLQALCHVEQLAEQPALFLPLAEHEQFEPEILQGVEGLSLLCIDDLDAIAGNAAWERALFIAVNDIMASHTRLVVGASVAPRYLPLKLADLRSRLQAAAVFQLTAPGDEEKSDLLQLRASRRGMNLSAEVANYILARTDRSVPALMAVLEALEASTLAKRRGITIPLVRETLRW